MGRKRKTINELKQSSYRVKKSRFKIKSHFSSKDPPKTNFNEKNYFKANDKTFLPEDSQHNVELLETLDESTNVKVNLVQNFENSNEDLNLGTFVAQVIRKNSIKYNLKRICVSDMLKEFRTKFPNLPSDYRTLLKTPRYTELRIVSPGQYTHFGILENLNIILRPNHNDVKIDIFIDGFSIFHDCVLKSFWIILGRHDKKIFPVGIYNGESQPKDFNDFLFDFAVEAKQLIKKGIDLQHRVVNFSLNKILMDSPAKSHVTLTKSHNGYGSCYYCQIYGFHDGSRVCFLETNCKLRTNKDFKEKVDTTFHKGVSVLESLGVLMIDQIPIDYLHCVLLGIEKKMLVKLFIHKSPLLSSVVMNKVSKAMLICNEFLCTEIHRKLRHLKDLKTYHGNELRLFLLKIGCVVLKNNIPNDIYNNFLLLHIAITILCDKTLCITKNDFANQCLKLFIRDAIEIYGTEIATSVLHDVQHLPEMVQKYQKPLDSFSTFPFENYLLKLKVMVHSNNKPLAQIHRRISEMIAYEENSEEMQDHQDNEFHFIYSRSLISSVLIKNFKYSAIGCKDRFILYDENVFVILGIKKNKKNETIFKVRKLKKLGNLYDLPVNSSKLYIYECATSYDGIVTHLNHSDIFYKMLGIPYTSYSMAFVPLKDMN